MNKGILIAALLVLAQPAFAGCPVPSVMEGYPTDPAARAELAVCMQKNADEARALKNEALAKQFEKEAAALKR